MSFLFRKPLQSKISPKDIDPDAVSVLRRLNKAGYTAYLVGGGVRDLLLERTPKDFDIVTNASPKQIKRLFRNAFLIGRRFRLALIRFGNKQIETATFRRTPEAEEADEADASAVGALYQGEDNQFGTPEEDAERRDFTVNALFYDIVTSEIIDYTGGLRDIQKRVLRCIGDPNIRFREDPVRMLRAIRLSARLDFTIHSASIKAIEQHSSEIMQASKPRLFEEITRLFTYSKSEEAFRRLWATGLMHELLPVLDGYINQTGGKKSNVWHYLAALDANSHEIDEVDKKQPFYTILENPIRLATLIAPCFIECCKHATEDDLPQPSPEDIAEQLVNEVFTLPYSTQSWRIPRFMCQDIVNLLDSLTYFKTQSTKRARFFRQAWFHSALLFWRIFAEANDDRDALPFIESWESAYDEYVIEHRSQRQRHDSATSLAQCADEIELHDNLFPPRKRQRRSRS